MLLRDFCLSSSLFLICLIWTIEQFHFCLDLDMKLWHKNTMKCNLKFASYYGHFLPKEVRKTWGHDHHKKIFCNVHLSSDFSLIKNHSQHFKGPLSKKTWAVHHDQKIFVLSKIGSFCSLRHSSSILHFTSYCSTWRKLKSVMIYADGFHIRLVASFVDSWKFLSWSCSFEWISNKIVGKWGTLYVFQTVF